MEKYTGIQAKELQQLATTRTSFMSVDAGHGHHTQAYELLRNLPKNAPASAHALTPTLLNFSYDDSEAAEARKLHFLNADVFTRLVPRYLPTGGIYVMNRILNGIYLAAGIIPELTKSSDYPWPITYNVERNLAGPMSRFINDTETETLVCTLTSSARIANVAKARGLVRPDLPVFNYVADPLGPRISYSVYDLRTEYGIDPYSLTIVSDHNTRNIFLSRGYRPEQVVVADSHYYRNDAEELRVKSKMRDFEYFRQHGPDRSHQLQIAVVHDNFETEFENAVSTTLLCDYATESAAGSIFFYITLTEAEIYNNALLNGFALISNPAMLEQFLTDLDLRKRYPGAIILKPLSRSDLTMQQQYSQMQILLAKGIHINVSRPSEHPRTAARFNSPSFLTVPFGPQEGYMAKLYQHLGFAGHWTQLSRSRFSRLRRTRSKLKPLDLKNPESYHIITKMAEAAGGSSLHGSTQDVMRIIDESLSR